VTAIVACGAASNGGTSGPDGGSGSSSGTSSDAGSSSGAGDASAPTALSVDVLNAGLSGANAPSAAARAAQLPSAVQQRESDLLCVVEVDGMVDRQAVIAAAKNGRFPYSYNAPTDLSTAITNPAERSGVTPPAPTAAPCASADPSQVSALLACSEQHCTTKAPGDATGQLAGSTSCLFTSCGAEYAAVQSASVGCYDCLMDFIVSGEEWGGAGHLCDTDARPPLTFGGQNSVTILSHYPLSGTDVLVLPSTNYRRVVEYAQVELPGGGTVDFYCGFFVSTLNAAALPYDGNYGLGASSSQQAYDNEQTYQAQQLVDWVKAKSGSAPAIVVGDWQSSLQGTVDAGAGTPEALNVATMQTLIGVTGWTPAAAASWSPRCNFCPSPMNPYNGATGSYFVEQPFLVNWPGDPTKAVTSEAFVFDQSSVALGGDAGVGPITPYYGLNIQVALSP
jgi:hypothetical protein